MNNRRKLAPHELAKRDQALAEASELANRGTPVIVVDHAGPGSQCCWCDCDAFIHDCKDPCPKEAEYIVQTSWSPQRYPVCDRHHTGPIELLAEYESSVVGGHLMQVSFRGGWMDDDC